MLNDKLKSVLSDVFDLKVDEINDTLSKDDISNWDSLTQMDLIVSLENEFGIELNFEEIVKMNSVKCILEVLSTKGL